jgi:hypothetical protein
MANDSYRIWCLVEGDTTIFPVTASRTLFIGELKDLIKVKNNRALNGVDADELKLWKVRMIMASDSSTNSPKGASRSQRPR